MDLLSQVPILTSTSAKILFMMMEDMIVNGVQKLSLSKGQRYQTHCTTIGDSSCLHWWYHHVFWFLWGLYRSSFEAYMDRLSDVLKRTSHTGLEISSKKCNIILYLWKKIQILRTCSVWKRFSSKIEAIKDWTTQCNVKDLSFVLPSFYEKTRW